MQMDRLHTDEQILISVILAVFNQDKFVSVAIESVISQTYANWELIICDDGSTDQTSSVLNYYKKLYTDKICILKNNKNCGVSLARNRALTQAKGDYIAFLDADDWWEKEKLQEQLAAFTRSDRVGLVFCLTSVVKNEGTSEKNRIFLQENFDRPGQLIKLKKKNLLAGNSICLSAIMVTKKAIERVAGFDPDLLYQCEDWLLIMKISYLFDFTYVPKKLVNYRLHDNSYSSMNFLKERMTREGFKQIYSIALYFAVRNLFVHSNTSLYSRLHFIYLLYFHRYNEDMLRWCQKSRILAPVRRSKKILGMFKRLLQKITLIGSKKLLILFVTSKCNSKCKTCFYWRSLNSKARDLELQELDKIFKNLPKTLCVLITGGEPFLRGDIEKVLGLTAHNKGILSVSVNTNGTHPEKTYSAMNQVLLMRKYPKPYHLNVSLDGFKDTHNRIRGIDCYDSALDTLKRALELKDIHKNFFASAITVINADNIDQINDFGNFIFDKMCLSFHYFEIIRGSPSDAGVLRINKFKLSRLYKEILLIQERYLRRNRLCEKSIKNHINKSAHLYRLQADNFFEAKPWDVKCCAGRNTFTVYEDGKFAICESRKSILNLQHYNFNLKKALSSKALKDEIKKMDSEKCFCTHGCFILNSIPAH